MMGSLESLYNVDRTGQVIPLYKTQTAADYTLFRTLIGVLHSLVLNLMLFFLNQDRAIRQQPLEGKTPPQSETGN